MSGEFEAAGGLATAGLVAGVIEGREGSLPVEGACLNCGAALNGVFCSQCGQNARPLRSLRHLTAEFFHNLFHFDTKAWRTLPMVLFRPGTLTRNYVFGKRARYISPLATFLLCVFLMFFVFSLVGGSGIEAEVNRTSREELAAARAELAHAREALAEAERDPPADEPEGLSANLARGAVQIAQAQVNRIEADLAAQAAREAEASNDEPAELATDDASPDAAGQAAERDAPPAPAREQRWQESMRDAVDRGDVDINLGHPQLNQRALDALRNPDLAIYKIQEAASRFSFLLAPLSLPFIALLFLWKRGVTFYDHVVYALYALSFASLLFITLIVGGSALAPRNVGALMILSNVLLFLALPVHTFFHLKGAYALGWWSALWRTFFMLMFALLIASIFLTVIVVLGLVG